MTEEIKGNNIPNNVLQDLGDLTNGAINYYQLPKTTLEEENIILNYITNLQNEIENLKDTIKKDNHLLGCNFSKKDKYKQEKDIYKQRNEKAIEYIDDNLQMNIITGSEYFASYSPCTDLLNILEGGDE